VSEFNKEATSICGLCKNDRSGRCDQHFRRWANDEIERLREERDMYMRSGRGEHDRLKRAEELEAENEWLQAEVEELSARPDWTAYNALADVRDENLEAAYYSVRDRLDEARADVRRLQADYERACKTIADLHVAGYVETEKAE
jgi:hypothetical protein